MKIRSLAIFSILLLTAACSMNDSMTSSSSMPGMIGYSDADIAAIITNANQGEVDQARVAIDRASSADVRAFAQMMVTGHGNALSQARSLLSRINVTPMDSDLSRNLQSGSRQTVSALNTYTGASFDRQYMQAQVDAHQWLLNTLDNTLIPSAHNRQFHDFLQTQRSAVASHLDRARQILNTLP